MYDKKDEICILVWFKQGMGDNYKFLLKNCSNCGREYVIHVKYISVCVQITLPQNAALLVIESFLLRAKTPCSGIFASLVSCSVIYVEWNPMYHEIYWRKMYTVKNLLYFGTICRITKWPVLFEWRRSVIILVKYMYIVLHYFINQFG